MNHSIKYLIVFLISLGFKPSNAQLTISAGPGASFFLIGSQGITSDYWRYTSRPAPASQLYEPPAYNFWADYKLSKRSAVGLAACYQYFNFLPNIVYDSLQRRMTVSRLNIAGRYLYYYNRKDTTSSYIPYLGVRVGLSFWKGAAAPGTYPFTFYSSLSKKSWILPSVQGFWGFRCYPFTNVKNLGLNCELGIGTPYFVEAGLVYRFQKPN
ncbi:MAG TPA: hypothetical protein VN922_10380 [Bacteroidia bacterium]|nr:hypothetical protein [Bacteroidia bacterium]